MRLSQAVSVTILVPVVLHESHVGVDAANNLLRSTAGPSCIALRNAPRMPCRLRQGCTPAVQMPELTSDRPAVMVQLADQETTRVDRTVIINGSSPTV